MTKAELTRALIIEKTAPVFNKRGYAGTSLTDLTKATGLTKGSIYGNFANKDEVAIAAFDFNLKKVNAILSNELRKKSSARGKLLAYINVYEDFSKHPFPIGGCPVMNTAAEADDTHPMLKQRACEAVAAWKKSVSGIIKAGIAAKEFNKHTDAERIAITIVASIEGAIMIANVTGKTHDHRLVLQSIRKMVEEL